MPTRFRLAAAIVSALLFLLTLAAYAQQAPIALPYTMTTIGGLAPMAATAGTQCPGLPAGVTSSDASGDGCLAANGIFGVSAFSGVAVDAFGNVLVNDDIKGVLHLINPNSGILTLVAGGNTACGSKLDATGDGCVAATGTPTTLISDARGVGIDPYGNVLLAGYNDHFVHLICRNASPLCGSGAPSAANPILIPIGNVGLVAGCAYATGSTGVSGAGTDATPGFTAATALFSGSPFVNAGGASSACTAALGEVDQPRGVTADAFGNVYYADTTSERWRVVLGPQSYNGVANPLWALLEQNPAWPTVTAGYVYTIAGITTTATTKGSSTHCNGSASFPAPDATDADGDGCLFTSASVFASSSDAQGVAVDAAGNAIFTDAGHGLLRVLFVSGSGPAGAAMVNAIEGNNVGMTPATPQPGFVYALAGGGGTGISGTPTLGSATSALDSSTTKVTVSPQGNIFIGDKTRVLFFDINTGYIRVLFSQAGGNVAAGSFCTGSSGPVSLSAYGDGCAASQAEFGNSNGLSVAVDGQGNLYLYDGTSSTSGQLVREVLAQGFAPQSLGTAREQIFEAHLLNASAATSTATLTATPDMSAGAPSCTLHADASVDCTVTVTSQPSAAGERSATLSVSNASSGTTANIGLGGAVSGPVLVADNAATTANSISTPIAPATNALWGSITPAGIALDGAGNVYAASGASILELIGANIYTLTPALPSTPSQISVDSLGDVFAVDSTTSTIEELAVSAAGTPAAFVLNSIAYTPCASCTAAPQAIAVDSAGNLFVADYQSGGSSIYRLSLAGDAVRQQATVATGLENPVALAVDPSGNVYAADKGTGKIYEYSPGAAGSYALNAARGTLLSGVTPVAVATDAAGDVYVQDASSKSVLEVPVSGPETVAVFTGLSSPAGLAVDGLGNVYSADAGNAAITQVLRGNVTENFGTSTSTAFTATLSNVGSLASTGQNTGSSNTTNFTVVAGGANGCAFSTNVLGAMAVGNACTLSAELTGTGTSEVFDTLSFLPAASAKGVLTLEGQLLGTSYPTTSTIGSATGTLTYAYSGTEAGFTITVAASTAPSAPTGSVNVYVDSTSESTQYALTAGSGTSSTATVNLSGLTAGNHTIAVVYPTTGQFTGSGSINSTTGFTIAQAATTTSWSPSAVTQQVSQAIGSGALNATAATSDATAQAGWGGTFAYTVTLLSGSPAALDASTYLPTGTYALGVTFTPTDAVDYATSTATVATYTVTQASTTATAGASTNVVAADGSGNYTNLTAALEALPTTGGTIYMKPGIYSGQNVISYPNVALRGLGGDPTQVVLSGENGDFSTTVPTGFSLGPAGKGSDEGSATLDVSKNAYIGTEATSGGTTYIPNNFYAEYLTVQNTYNTDPATTSLYTASSNGGTCTLGATAHSLQTLFNSNEECGSQALALYLTSDQAILNNVNLVSRQDTFYGAVQGCGTFCTVARQYLWQGLITGDVDYIFGDAALVLDHTSIFTTWNGITATGEETVEAQDMRYPTGSSSSYLSGFICNGCTLMSQSAGMTNLYYGRPWDISTGNYPSSYSTWIMLNSTVDQVNPSGWIGWDGHTEYLNTATYAEYNTMGYSDPAISTSPAVSSYPYPASLFNTTPSVLYTYSSAAASDGAVVSAGGNPAAGTTSPAITSGRESYATQLTAAEAVRYYPVNFLGTTVSAATLSAGQPSTWNPVTSLAARVNAFAPAGNVTLQSYGSSVTILGRPVTPGAGILPTGSYQFMDGGTVLASGNLDASGEAYLTTSTLPAGAHSITMIYGGDSNFTGSTSTAFTITVPPAPLTPTTTALTVSNPSSTYGGTITGTATVTANSGSGTPTGTVTLLSGSAALGTCPLSGGLCSYALTGVAAGVQAMTASYSGDTSYSASTSSVKTFTVSQAILQVAAANATMIAGGSLPAFTYTTAGYVNGDGPSALSGSPSITTAATGSAVGEYPILISTGTLTAGNYTFAFTSGELFVNAAGQGPAVATGDSRTVTEPVFPAVCTTLTAALTSVNNDIPASVDATVTNPDGARIQAALNSCAGTGQAVELSMDGAGHDAYLTGPLTMPSNVTLLVDPGVYVYFSRNVQDYDTVPGTHTCGTVNSASATASCLPLIDINNATNVGIMGFGKLDGRGGDALINAFPATYAGQSWWGLSSIANSGGTQQNPRFVQIDSGSSNVTLYKITLRNSPLFHISTTGSASNFTAWDIKIVTPTSSRNTDGIDPGNAQNFTITRSWISDGDDNVAVGAAGTTAPAANISVTNNHFFAGHGESIGSYTSAGVSNVLFDGNLSSGNGVAGSGSSINNTADSNSTGLRIKSGYDRGGLVTNIQYSNSCYQDHKAEIVFSPNYEATTGAESPNFTNILMQNLTFLTEGTAQFTGTNNNGTIYPLQVALDNVSFPGTYPVAEFSTAPTNAALSYGPGQVSTDFINDFATFAGANGNTVANNITETTLEPPACSFTYIAPELTGPNGLPQTITEGQNATAVVILTPAVGGAAYPTGTVTLTDALTSNTTTVALPGTTDTIFIPLSGLTPGTHTFTATYSGDSNYTLTSGQSVYSTTAPYLITVNSGSLGSTTTTLSGVPSSTPFGTSFTATATVAGSSPTGNVQFIVNGSVFATAMLSSGTASASISLPYSTSSYSIYAVYNGDAANDGSTSSAASVTVTAALTTTALSANTTTATLGHPVALTAYVTSAVGAPPGTVTFTYTTTGSSTPQPTTAILNNGIATAGVLLPVGTDSVTATYAASGSYAGSASAPMSFTVTVGTILGLPANPIALPYTMTTLAGGAASNCAGATDSFGDGCQGTSMVFGGSVDLRSVVADPFGNVYLTDAVANLVRRIAPNGVIGNFAGRVSGTACVPSATTGCTPTQVSMDKPRGISSDALGNIYIAGYDSHEIFKVSVANGLLYLVAGTGTAGNIGDGGAATAAEVNAPRGVWADTLGNVYIADTSNNKIRVVDITGNIHTFAGTGTAASNGDGGLATLAAIDNPQGVMTDANLNVYIADAAKVRVVCVTCGTGSPLDALLATLGISAPLNGYIYTIAGGAASSYSGAYPTPATNVTLSPQKLAIDGSSNVYISDGNGAAWFVDSRTASIRPIAGKTAANCAGETDNFGDGCPATQAIIGDGGNGIGVGTDALGNLYISDTLNARIRKVTTDLASRPTATNNTNAQPVEIHFIAGDAPASSNALVYSSSEWSVGAPNCTANADTTTDCLLSVSFTPAVGGGRSTPLTVNSALGNTANPALTGTGLGAGSTLDPASKISFGTNLQIAGLATDAAGNVYVSDANSKQLLRFAVAALGQGASAPSTSLVTLGAPGAVAVDARGYVYVADTSTGLITQISPSGATSTLPLTLTAPAGLTVDALNNLYVSDSSAQAVYQLNPITGAHRTLAVGTLVAPAGLTVDPAGNLLITDPGAGAIYRFNLQSGATTAVSSSAVKPSAIATDAAGNLLIADTASILAVPASSNSAAFTVASLAPSALAIDSAGNLYTGSGGSVLKLIRTQGTVQFTGASALPQTVNLLESGNQALQLASISQTDSADYSITATPSSDCVLNGSLPSTLAVGGTCTITAAYTPTTFVTTTDTATLNGNLANAALSTPPLVQLVLSGPTTPPASAIALNAFSPASPVYGQTITVSATVSGPSITPAGTVVFTVDGSTTDANLIAGVATATMTGLSAGSHTVSAAYTSSNGFAPSTTTQETLTITQAAQRIPWADPAGQTAETPLALPATASSGLAVSYITFTPAICTISTDGGGNPIALMLAYGNCSLKAEQAGNIDYSAAPAVSWTFFVHHAAQTISWADPVAQTAETPLALTGSASSGLPVSYITYTPSICTISTDGSGNPIALMLASGNCSLQAEQAGNATYGAATDVGWTFFVHHAGQTISWADPVAQTAETPLALTGTASSGLPVSYITYTPSICTISTDGSGNPIALMLASGNCSLQAEQAGNATYGAATDVGWTFFVHHAGQTITFPAVGTQTAGNSVLLPATASSGLAVSYASTTPGVCTINVTGLYAVLAGPGTCTVQASQAGNAAYGAAATVTQSFTVVAPPAS